jgi:KaiC/GvpD/RAD55 family RecA-like ATPase
MFLTHPPLANPVVMTDALQAFCMSDLPRAFLTPGEREAADPESDMDPDIRSAHLSRVRRKIEKMRGDMEVLRDHRPEIARQLEEAVCREQLEGRIRRLEAEVEALREQSEQADGDGSGDR